MSKYDYTIFIGRMQPPTNAHIATIKQALDISDHVIILLGSSFQPRTIKNPWNHHERASMIINELPSGASSRIIFVPIRDYRYNDQDWVRQVQKIIKLQTSPHDKPKIGVIGCNKDQSSYYLNYFPQWDLIPTEHIVDIDATTVRNEYFENRLMAWRDYELISSSLKEYLQSWAKTTEYQSLQKEYQFIVDYKKGWANSPYPPTFLTSDAVVIQSGHVLLIQRKSSPGENLWALPGGFVNQDETIETAVIRELREETRLKVPDPVLKGSIIGTRIFDAPNRSLRGRTVTNAYAIKLAPGPLAKAKGSDDAKKAKWFPINDVLEMEQFLFEDHLDIINWAIGLCD